MVDFSMIIQESIHPIPSSSPTCHHLSIWLVVSTPLKNMSSSVGVTIPKFPNIWKVIIQPCSSQHQPVFHDLSMVLLPVSPHFPVEIPHFPTAGATPLVARHPPTPRCSWRSVAPRAGTGTFHRGRFKI